MNPVKMRWPLVSASPTANSIGKTSPSFVWPLTAPAITDDSGLAGFQVPADVAVVFFPVGSGHQHLDIAADDLFGLVAEQLCRRCAERGHDAASSMTIIASGTVSRIERRCASRPIRLGLDPLQFSDVDVDLKDGRDFPSSIGRATHRLATETREPSLFRAVLSGPASCRVCAAAR